MTVIVTGLPGGGTTCVARVVNALGIPVVTNGKTTRACEHDALNDAIVSGDWGVADQLVAKFDLQFERWAFKRPLLYGHLIDNFHRFRNPEIVYVFRDPLAISLSVSRHSGQRNPDAMKLIIEEQLRMTHLLPHAGVPVFFVSYERFVTRGDDAVKELAEHLRVPYDPTAVAEVVFNDPRYREKE